jgi:hypothetical protein
MCRLVAITSKEYFSPMENVLALDTMKEGHDGSGLGLVLKHLGGEFENLKDYPILSVICSEKGMKTLDSYMEQLGFQVKHVWKPKVKSGIGISHHDGSQK